MWLSHYYNPYYKQAFKNVCNAPLIYKNEWRTEEFCDLWADWPVGPEGKFLMEGRSTTL